MPKCWQAKLMTGMVLVAMCLFIACSEEVPGEDASGLRRLAAGLDQAGASRLPNGAACNNGSECDTGMCIDGVCCDSPCAGFCLYCALEGFEGNCRYIPEGQDPDSECTGEPPCGSTCNGSGGCLYPTAGTVCGPCGLCDGMGACSQFEAQGSDPQDVCGPCRVCPGNGPDCVPVSQGSDPHDECSDQAPAGCGLTGDCDGQGSCEYHSPQTECVPERCEAGVHQPADLCDGSGHCADSGSVTCAPYICLNDSTCRNDCSSDEHCAADHYCDSNECMAYLQRGEACSTSTACITGHCTDFVCCDQTCGDACEFCNFPQDPGGCLPVPDGEDPREDCPGTGLCGGVCDGQLQCRFMSNTVKCAPCSTCDGEGECSFFAPQGTDPFDDCMPCWTCSGLDASCQLVPLDADPQEECPESPAASCGLTGTCDGEGACQRWPPGTICKPAACDQGHLQPADACDGQGVCQDAGELDCNGHACLAEDACRTDCMHDSHCLDGYHCQQSSCQSDLQDGQTCQRDAQCASGHCADSVCCHSACSGVCERCDLTGTQGDCVYLPAGQDPDAECNGDSECVGACDGDGACLFPSGETHCAACARCDGLGGCTLFVQANTDPQDVCGSCRICPGNGPECTPVPSGSDTLDECGSEPAESCGQDGACDGAGACRLWTRATPCGVQQCLGDTLTRAPTCDGAGNCLDQGSESCAPYLCEGDNCPGPEGLHRISVEDAAGGQGKSVESLTLTTDDTLRLYAIGRDESNDYLGDIPVNWYVTGGVGTVPLGPSRNAIFDPARPGIGQVVAEYHDQGVVSGATGRLTVDAGVAAGSVRLTPDPRLLPADGVSSSLIQAGPVTDADGNPVVDGTTLTVLTSAGSLLGEDDDPDATGFQRITHAGMFSFQVRSDPTPARVRVLVTATPPGTAQGEVILYFGGDRPMADAGFDRVVRAGSIVSLDGTSSFDPFERPLTYSWSQTQGKSLDLQDADTATPSFVSGTGAGQEVLSFELIVHAAWDVSDPDEVHISVVGDDPQLPVAHISVDPESGPAPLEVLLDASASSSARDALLRDFIWTFSDDVPARVGPQITRTFAQPGGYGVGLTVTDSLDRFSMARARVLVLDGDNQPPLLAVASTATRGEAPLEVEFHAQASDPDGELVQIEWDFGGGFLQAGPDQTKTYAQAGTHRVRVRAVDDQGLSSSDTLYVFVSDQGTYLPFILSTPPATAWVGKPYTYLPKAVGTPVLSWSLGKTVGSQTWGRPAGMQVKELVGAVSWTPSKNQAGTQEVTLVATNAAGSDFQDYEIQVIESPSGPDGCACSSRKIPTGPGSLFGMLLLLGGLRCGRRKSVKPADR